MAIKHLSDSLKDNPKTTFLLAREYYKLGKHDIADSIERGYKVNQLKEYKYHFAILKELNKGADINSLEAQL